MHSNYMRSLTLLLVSGSACLQAAALEDYSAPATQQAQDEKSSYQLDRVGVAAKRAKEKPESPYATTASSQLQTEVITREEIEAIHPQTAWEILEQVPGFSVEYQGRQHQEFPTMRGGTGSFGIILDGVYITQVDRVVQSLPVDAIESVTVVRDATALTLGPLTNFGSSFSGNGGISAGSNNQGFIIIKTRRAAKPEAGFGASYGRYQAEKYNLYGGSKTGRFDYRLSGSYNSDPGKPGLNMETRNTSVYFKGGYTGDTFEAELLGYWGHGKRNLEWGYIALPTYTSSTNTYNWSKVGTYSVSAFNMTRLDASMAALNLTKRWNASQTTTFNLGYNGVAATVETSPTTRPTPQNTYGTTASLRHTINSGNNTLKVGIQRLTLLAPNGSANSGGGPSMKRSDEQMNSAYLEDEYRMFGGRLTLDGGLRLDHKILNSGYLTGRDVTESARTAPAYTLGLAYKPIEIITLTGRFAYSENDPSRYLLTKDSSILHTEKRKRYEAGILANLHAAFNPFATVYYYDTRNQKVSTGTSASDYYIDPLTGDEYNYVTEKNVRTRGIEGGTSGQILRPLGYKLSWSYVGTDNATTNSSISRHLATASLRYRQGVFGANVSAHYAGPKTQTAGIYTYTLADYTRVDANVEYSFKFRGMDTKVTAYGRNLGNTQYATRYNTGAYLDPGLTYGLQLACKFF